MGRTRLENQVKFFYTPEIIAGWNKLTDEQKEIFNQKGREFGYSGMNVFLVTLIVYFSYKFGSGNPFKFFWVRKT